MCNLYAGALSFLALGQPKHLPTDGSSGLSEALRATSRNAMTSSEEGLRTLLRVPRSFQGASGGRAVLAAKLREFEPSGSGQERGPIPPGPSIASVTEQLRDSNWGGPVTA